MTFRRAYIEANIFELFVAVLAIVAAVGYFIDPHNTAGQPTAHVTYPEAVWNTMYGGGAVLVAAGIVMLSVWVELAGLSLFSSATTIQVLGLAGLGGWRAWLGIVILGSFALASLTRGWVLVRQARQ